MCVCVRVCVRESMGQVVRRKTDLIDDSHRDIDENWIQQLRILHLCIVCLHIHTIISIHIIIYLHTALVVHGSYTSDVRLYTLVA